MYIILKQDGSQSVGLFRNHLVSFHTYFYTTDKKRILGECLLISSLPGIARFAKGFNMRSRSGTW